MSLVFRAEDVWQRCNQFIETAEFLIRVSPSHPTMQTGQDSDGCLGVFEEMCTLHAVVMLCIVFVAVLQDRVDDSFR